MSPPVPAGNEVTILTLRSGQISARDGDSAVAKLPRQTAITPNSAADAGLYPVHALSSLVQELNCPESAHGMAVFMDRDQISFGPFCLDLGQRKLSFQGTPVRLGSRALDILHVLALANGDVVSKDQLLEKVWPGLTVEENNIQV